MVYLAEDPDFTNRSWTPYAMTTNSRWTPHRRDTRKRSTTTSRGRPTTGSSGRASASAHAQLRPRTPSGTADAAPTRSARSRPGPCEPHRPPTHASPARGDLHLGGLRDTNAATLVAFGGTRASHQTGVRYRIQVAQSATITDANAIDDRDRRPGDVHAVRQHLPRGRPLVAGPGHRRAGQPAGLVRDPQDRQGHARAQPRPGDVAAPVERPAVDARRAPGLRHPPERRPGAVPVDRRDLRRHLGHRGLQERRHQPVLGEPGVRGAPARQAAFACSEPLALLVPALPLARPAHRRDGASRPLVGLRPVLRRPPARHARPRRRRAPCSSPNAVPCSRGCPTRRRHRAGHAATSSTWTTVRRRQTPAREHPRDGRVVARQQPHGGTYRLAVTRLRRPAATRSARSPTPALRGRRRAVARHHPGAIQAPTAQPWARP